MQENKLKKLPIGIQTFSEIVKENYIYIDKTRIALDLIENNKYVFLSRPRRFGKSLFLDTLKNIFLREKELFKNLYIYDNYDFIKKYPVINISFAAGRFENRGDLSERWDEILRENEENLDVKCDSKKYDRRCFRELIKKTYEKYNQKVVILIDEYDKPILDTIENSEISNDVKNELSNFYSVMKASDEYLRFVFLTGVSKFSKVSVFSGLNNIKDISLTEKYGDICGYTQNDIETSFLPYLDGVDLEKLKEWYNGYNFLGSDVYNPFDILLFISDNFKYRNYWFETGTPTFLIHLLRQKDYFIPELENLVVGEEIINSFDINNISLETILFQAGYLTIDECRVDEMDLIEYKLKVPNKEVRVSLNNMFIDYLTDDTHKLRKRQNIFKSLKNAKMEELKKTLISLFASIPYNNFVNNKIYEYEGYYASVIYAYFASLGIIIISEDVTNLGRIDMTIDINNRIYIIEFKTTKENALEQIKEKNYHQKYLDNNKEIILVGINFDREKKNISNFEWEVFNG